MRFSQFSLKKFAGIAAAIAILPVAVACDTATETPDVAVEETEVEAPMEDAEADMMGDTIVDVAVANGSFDTLVAALEAAGLADTLNGEGPFTVFAPTDEAFAALPEGVLDALLLLPENSDTLTEILTYHVVSGEVMAADVVTGPATALNEDDLALVSEAGVVTVNGVEVSTADVAASNGVIHVIDSVLVPESVDVSAL